MLRRFNPHSTGRFARTGAVVAFVLFAAIGGAVPGGCTSGRIGGSTPADQVINELREENLALAKKLDALARENELRRKQIDVLEQKIAATHPAVEGVVPGDLPRLVSVAFDSYTSAIDTDHDGDDDALRLYVLTSDQQGRFIPIAGRAVAQAVVIEPGQAPVELTQKIFDPPALDAAYRTGLTGTHYSLEVPLPRPLPKGINEVTVKLTLTDAATGATVSCEQGIKLKRK
jgi:hypothetical protein